MSIRIYKNKAFQMRKELMEKFYVLKEGHPGSVFSIMDVLIVLYYGKFLRIRKKNNIYLPIDDLIISKGHATVGQYPILKDLLVIKKSEWNNWGIKKSFLKMFGNIEIPGIKTATGSLGHGIGFGTGIAFYAKKNKIKKEVYVIISEGELYEGSTWESLLLLSSLKLDNVTIILDVNNNIILGNPKDCLSLGNIMQKIKSFGIYTEECDAHNFKSLDLKFKKFKKIKKPKCLIVNSIKGKGFKIMEGKAQWHYYNPISEQQYENIQKDLKKNYENYK